MKQAPYSSKQPRPRFAPIHINWDSLRTDRLANLYKFGRLLFPTAAPSRGLLTKLLDLENEMHRAFLNVPEGERNRITRGLAGITLELKIAVADETAGELVSIPLRIEPALVMKRALLGKGPSPDLQRELWEMKKALLDYIKKEWKKKMREVLEGFFKREALRARIKGAIKELMGLGAITRRGKLAPETTIEDLVTGKYAGLFSKAATEEVVKEGLVIHETLTSLFEWGELTPEEWAGEAREELDLIGKSLEALKP